MVNEFLPLLYSFHFYLFGLIAVAAAITFVTRKSPVSAALWLVVVMFCLAALYVMMDAQFVGVMQVLVYAGAIMVVFVFVVMLLNLGEPAVIADVRGKWGSLAAGFLASSGQIFFNRFTGPGRVGIQSMYYHPPVATSESQTQAAVGGGILGAVMRGVMDNR